MVAKTITDSQMNATHSHRRSIRRNLLGGVTIIALLFGVVGGFAATIEISGAIIAHGVVVVASNGKKVQHPTGGIVSRILVRDGAHVEADDLLVQLSDVVPRANLAFVTRSLDELYARKSRLEAERDGDQQLTIAPTLTARMSQPEVAALVESERRLFEIRRLERSGNKARLRERIEQLQKQIEGYLAQGRAKKKEIELIREELQGIRDLVERKLTPLSKLTAYERDATRIEGERAQLIASTAQARGAIAEVLLQILQLDKEFSSSTGSELRDVDAKIAEFEESQVTATDQLLRVDIRAPASGTVHQSTVHTIGGVIGAGEPIMMIIPDHDVLAVEAKVAPQDIDQIQVGQSALLRFTAFNQRITPEFQGVVSLISADVTHDQRTNESYYVARITPTLDSPAHASPLALVPGMPAEVFITIGDRTVMSYLMKPLSDQMMRAFRDE